MGWDWFIFSGVFSVDEHDWLIGFNIGVHPDFVIVVLALLPGKGAPRVRASYELRLVDQSTGLPVPVHKEAPRTFSFNPDDGGDIDMAIDVINRSIFEAPAYLSNDCLTVDFIVTVVRGPLLPETETFPRIEVPSSNIAEHFGKLFEGKEGTDVAFIVGGETFAAHKIVLAARSPVFKAELYGPMREAATEAIVIKDMHPDVFRALLHFIYNDSLPPMDGLNVDGHGEMVRGLLVAADRYDVERLKLMCQSILCENLNVETVAITLALADQHHCGMLKDACIITRSNLMDAVAATPGYENLKRTCPSLVIEALEKTSGIHKA